MTTPHESRADTAPSIPSAPLEQQILAPRLPSLETLGLATTTLQAHGVLPDGAATIYVNNNTGAEIRGGRVTAFDVVPDPACVAPLTYYAVPTLKAGEYALTLPLPPGFVDYYVMRGLLNSSDQALQVNPMPGGFGYPHLDPLAIMQEQELGLPTELEGARFVCTFPSNLALEHARAAGGETVQSSDPRITNNKAFLRTMAEKYGFLMSPGIEVKDAASVEQALQEFNDSPRLWVKLAHGAGGDTVLRVNPPYTKEVIEAAIDKLRVDVNRNFANNQFSSDAAEAYWPNASYSPIGTSVLIEADAGVYGEVIDNCAAMVVVNHDGSSEVITYTRQFTADGAYLGNECLTPSAETKPKIDKMLAAVARMYNKELGYSGIFGVDYLLVRNASGEEVPVVIEANGRPINSTYALIVAQKIGATYWINAKLESPVPLSSFAALEPLLTDAEGRSYAWETDPAKGCIVPTILDSLHSRSEDGNLTTLREGHSCRVVIGSNQSLEHCREILAEVREKFARAVN